MIMTAEMLARIQFGLTSGFHYIYPPMSIGLGLMLCIFEGIYLKTKDVRYKQITRFWTKVFALTFALGVATPRACAAVWVWDELGALLSLCGRRLRQRAGGGGDLRVLFWRRAFGADAVWMGKGQSAAALHLDPLRGPGGAF